MSGNHTHYRLPSGESSSAHEIDQPVSGEQIRAAWQTMEGAQESEAFLVELAYGARYPLRGFRFLIGRGDVNHIEVKDNSVSRVHAVIAVEDGIYHIDDLGSTNGTFLNGNIVIRRRPLHDRDIIKVGDTKFAFTYEQRNSKSACEITSKLTHL